MLMRYVFLIAAISLAGTSFSNEPDNHPAVTTKNQEAKSHNANTDFDAPSLEKAIRDSIKEASDKQAANSDEHLNNEGKLVEYTSQLALATDRLAKFTFWLVFITAILAVIAGGQIYMFSRQLSLMRKEFLATHPPKLVVRRVCFVQTPLQGIQYIITNVGDSDAIIIQSDVAISIDSAGLDNPFFPPYSGELNLLGNLTIPAGGREVLYAYSVDLLGSKEAIDRGLVKIMLVGWFTYKNPSGNSRYTAFGRIFDAKKGGFTTMEGHTPKYDRYDYSN